MFEGPIATKRKLQIMKKYLWESGFGYRPAQRNIYWMSTYSGLLVGKGGSRESQTGVGLILRLQIQDTRPIRLTSSFNSTSRSPYIYSTIYHWDSSQWYLRLDVYITQFSGQTRLVRSLRKPLLTQGKELTPAITAVVEHLLQKRPIEF